jgi:hypothetical protein
MSKPAITLVSNAIGVSSPMDRLTFPLIVHDDERAVLRTPSRPSVTT